MMRDPQFVMKYIGEVEVIAEDILADKQRIVDLDGRRNKNREVIRSLINTSKQIRPCKNSWVCFGNTFINFRNDKLHNLLDKEQKEIDLEIANLRKNLKRKVNKLNDLEGKPELRGFETLQPLTRKEMDIINKL